MYIYEDVNFNVSNSEEADLAVYKINEFLNKACYLTFKLIKIRLK